MQLVALAGHCCNATVPTHEEEPSDPEGRDAGPDVILEQRKSNTGPESLNGARADRSLQEDGQAADPASRSRPEETMQGTCVQGP